MNSKRSLIHTIFLSAATAGVLLLSSAPAIIPRAFADLNCSGTVGADSQQQGAICLPPDPTGTSSAFAQQSPEDVILEVIQIMLSVAVIIAVVFVIIGGYQYIFDAGSDERAAKGRKTITNALIGLVVIILSFTVVTIVSRTASNPDSLGNSSYAPTNQNNTNQSCINVSTPC